MFVILADIAVILGVIFAPQLAINMRQFCYLGLERYAVTILLVGLPC